MGQSGITVQLTQESIGKKLPMLDLDYSIEDSQIHFSVKNPELVIPRIIQELTTKNIAIHSIKTKTSSLEDVFLSLTGKRINE